MALIVNTIWLILAFDLLILLAVLRAALYRTEWKRRALAAEQRLADVIDLAGEASASDGRWMAALLQRKG